MEPKLKLDCFICGKEGADDSVVVLDMPPRHEPVHRACYDDALEGMVWYGGYAKEKAEVNDEV